MSDEQQTAENQQAENQNEEVIKINLLSVLEAMCQAIEGSAMTDSSRQEHLDFVRIYIEQEKSE